MQLTRRGRAVTSAGVAILIAAVGWLVAAALGSSSSDRLQLSSGPSVAPMLVTPSATPSPHLAAPTSSPAPKHHHVTASPTAATKYGDLVVVPGTGKVVGHGPLRRYKVEVQAGVAVSGASFAAAVERTLGDERDWGRDFSFQRVSSGHASFTVTLASPATTDRLCRPLDTGGDLSCHNNDGRSVINSERWQHGAATYGNDLADYRIYVVSHEVGHALGHGHQFSCLSSGLAPVMMQQTKSLMGCKINPWPHPDDD